MEMDGFSDRLIGGLMVSLPGIEPSAFSSALTGGWSACMQMKCRHANEPRGSAQILTGDGEEKRKIFFLIFDWIFFFYLKTKLRRRSGNNTHTHTQNEENGIRWTHFLLSTNPSVEIIENATDFVVQDADSGKTKMAALDCNNMRLLLGEFDEKMGDVFLFYYKSMIWKMMAKWFLKFRQEKTVLI